MARFTGTYYADLARLRIEDLREQTIAPPSNGPASTLFSEEDISDAAGAPPDAAGNRMDGLNANKRDPLDALHPGASRFGR
jgi:hypothetical protein